MDWNPIPFEPNLKFTLELKEDLKKKYLDQHVKAKQTLERFSCSLQNIYHEHQRLLSENIELSITKEKLLDIIKFDSKQPNIALFPNTQASEVLGASPNCNLKKSLSRTLIGDNKKNNAELTAEKENIDQHVAIYSCDFESEVDFRGFQSYKSPPASVVNSPVKVQNSPILSKGKKRLSLKKSNSSMSNTSSHSAASSTDDKISILERSITDSDKELEANLDIEALRNIENTFLSSSVVSQDNSKRFLGVSKTNYARTSFLEKGKRLRQTTLSSIKPVRVIDISKIDCDKNNSIVADSKISVNKLRNDFCENSKSDSKKECYTSKNVNKLNLNNSNLAGTEKINFSTKDDELIEVSPAHSEKSKLRAKLTWNKKSEMKKSKAKSSNAANHEKKLSANTFEKDLSSTDNKLNNNNCNVIVEKGKCQKAERTFSDETYFSQGEVNVNEDENDTDNGTPPAKRMLLNSFDQIPNRKEKSPDFAYKEAPVRNKNQKLQLPGWDCRDCEMWYKQFPEGDREGRKNFCSKHRGKYKADVHTPDSFWNPGFDDLSNSSSFDD